MKRRILYSLSAILFILSAQSQQTPEKFVQETKYLLSLPEGYNMDTARRWPLLIFLHGSGEAGYDLNKVKVHGPPKLAENGKKFPFIIVSPQAWPQAGWDADHLYRFLKHIKQTQRVDDNKVYMTGLSMGGYGTWSFAMKYPGELAAIAPVCGGGDSTNAWRFRYVPVWNFHGAKDDVVLPGESEKMVMAARRYNREVRYTLYPNANHNSWDLTYDNDSLYQWLLSKSKFSFREKPLSADLAKKYIGSYTGTKDTVRIAMKNNNVVVIAGRDTIPIKHGGERVFYFESGVPDEFRFQQVNNTITGFLFLGRHKEFYTKLK